MTLISYPHFPLVCVILFISHMIPSIMPALGSCLHSCHVDGRARSGVTGRDLEQERRRNTADQSRLLSMWRLHGNWGSCSVCREVKVDLLYFAP